jgi:hypothetical protein
MAIDDTWRIQQFDPMTNNVFYLIDLDAYLIHQYLPTQNSEPGGLLVRKHLSFKTSI